MEEGIYYLAFGIILISGYFTYRVLNHFFGYYRERTYIDKVLEYGLFGICGFLFVYYLSGLLSHFLNKPFIFEDFLIYYTPLFMLASVIVWLSYQLMFGYKTRNKKMSLFEKYHMKDYREGWLVIHLRNGEIFSGRLAFTDVDYETKRFNFSLKFVRKVNKDYEILNEYKDTIIFAFNMKDVLYIEYKKQIKKKKH